MANYSYCPDCGNHIAGGYVTPQPIVIEQPANVSVYEQPKTLQSYGGFPVYSVPPPYVNSTVRNVGTARFDPDPRTTTRTVQPAPERRQVMGPYGPGGSMIPITGKYVPPTMEIAETIDIPEHPVSG